MRIEKRDHIFTDWLAVVRREMIPRAPVSESVAVARHSESLVPRAQYHTLVFESTTHRNNLVIRGWVLAVTVDKEKRLECPA